MDRRMLFLGLRAPPGGRAEPGLAARWVGQRGPAGRPPPPDPQGAALHTHSRSLFLSFPSAPPPRGPPAEPARVRGPQGAAREQPAARTPPSGGRGDIGHAHGSGAGRGQQAAASGSAVPGMRREPAAASWFSTSSYPPSSSSSSFGRHPGLRPGWRSAACPARPPPASRMRCSVSQALRHRNKALCHGPRKAASEPTGPTRPEPARSAAD